MRAGDVLLTWNLHGDRAAQARRFEASGGVVIVAEEAYTRGLTRTKRFALARHGHNGSGAWRRPARAAPGDRVAELEADGLRLHARHTGDPGGYLLICGQRGIGHPEMASPPGFAAATASDLRARGCDRPIKIRPHPGKHRETQPPVDDDLDGAAAVVIWSSAVGVRALCRGIPVAAYAPHWIMSACAQSPPPAPPAPPIARVRAALDRLGWAQWTLDEIEGGAAFETLLHGVPVAQIEAAA